VQHVKNFRIFPGPPGKYKVSVGLQFFSTTVPKVEMKWVKNL
jgi:hypothetical protein